MNKHTQHGKSFFLQTAFCIGLSCLSFLFSCGANWEKNVTKHGIRFKKLRPAANGESWTGYIEQDLTVGQYQCHKGWIRFYKDWSLKSCVITTDMTLSGNAIPAGSWIELDQDGALKLCAFPRNTEVQGYLCKGTGGAPKHFHTSFYPDGALKYCSPVKAVRIDGIPCQGGFFHNIGLYPDGRLMQCTLSEPIELQGVRYARGTVLKFEPDGNVAFE